MPITFDVHRLQRGLQFVKEDGSVIPGVTWPRATPLTCTWDQQTSTRVRNLCAYMNNEHPLIAMASGIPSVGELVMTPSADQRSVTINVGSIVRSQMDEQIARYGEGTCAMPANIEGPPPPTPPGDTLPVQTMTGVKVPNAVSGEGILCLCVERVASGLVADGTLTGPWLGMTWNKEFMQAFSVLFTDLIGRSPEFMDPLEGDSNFYLRMPGASTPEEAIVVFQPIQDWLNEARADAGIRAPVDCCPRIGVAPIMEGEQGGIVDEGEVEVAEAGVGTDWNIWLALGAGVGVVWMFWKLVGKKPRK